MRAGKERDIAVRRTLLESQAEAVGLPLRTVALPWPCPNEAYEDAMRTAMDTARAEGIEVIAFGDLFLEDVRRFREDGPHPHGAQSVGSMPS